MVNTLDPLEDILEDEVFAELSGISNRKILMRVYAHVRKINSRVDKLESRWAILFATVKYVLPSGALLGLIATLLMT